jgi:putative chitobiose transport system substrate-binding protein
MGDFAPYINKVISEFEAQNPEIKIKWVDVPFSEGEKRTLASVLSDNPPDLINLNPDFSALLAQRGALYEIDEKYSEQYNESIINSLKYNGKLYSLPWYATSAITIYNKELVNKAKVKVPKTYNDIVQIAPSIKLKTSAYVMLPNITENDTMLRILNKYGVNSTDINSEKSKKVFEMFKLLYAKDLIPKETITQTHREALEKYMAEKIVFFQAGANFLTMIKENSPSTYKKTDVAIQLAGDLGQYDFSLMNFIIPLKAKHKDEALKFAIFLTNEENQLELGKLTNVLAVNEKTLQNDFYTKYDENDLLSKARVLSASQLNKIEPALKAKRNQKEINTLINTAVQQILLDKDSIQNVLDDVAKKYNEL